MNSTSQDHDEELSGLENEIHSRPDDKTKALTMSPRLLHIDGGIHMDVALLFGPANTPFDHPAVVSLGLARQLHAIQPFLDVIGVTFVSLEVGVPSQIIAIGSDTTRTYLARNVSGTNQDTHRQLPAANRIKPASNSSLEAAPSNGDSAPSP